MSFGKKCFDENLQLFGMPARTNAEKFNLYNGLKSMADDLDSLSSKINNMENNMATELRRIKASIDEIKREI